jgi:hypothetical protein
VPEGSALSEPPRSPPPPLAARISAREWVRLLRWPLATVVAVALLIALLWRLIVAFESAGRAAAGIPGAAAEQIAAIARGFLTGNVTETFLAALPTVAPIAAGHLEVAVAESVETVTRSDERSAFWDLVPLGTTTVEVRVPVTYRYHVRLDEDWSVVVEDGFCRVQVPALRASQPPAIHTHRIERRAESSWLRFDAAEQLAALERQLTPRLQVLAADPRHLALVREPARQTVARFVRAWLLTQGSWSAEGVRAIHVSFADDRAAGLDSPVTLVLGD